VRNVVNNAARIGSELGVECRGVAFQCETGFVPVDRLPSPSADGPQLIGAALEARRDPDFVIVARTDSFATVGFAEGIRRSNRALEVGAQMIICNDYELELIRQKTGMGEPDLGDAKERRRGLDHRCAARRLRAG
jgi:2-methylisocitrate lyase-like PEP mutase family enzyme